MADLIDLASLEGMENAIQKALDGVRYDWRRHARPNQIAPAGDWRAWLLLAGRGFGKTRTGAEWVRQIKGSIGRIALVAPTASDARDVMVEGESGLLAISPPWDRPVYEPSKRRLTWDNGAQATTYSADEPERLRGPQHGAAWLDELCLVAGTMIETAAGRQAIETINVGQMVQTRVGLRRVLNAAETSSSASVYRLTASDGSTIDGTAHHPVFVEGIGFVPLCSVRPGAMLKSWISSTHAQGRVGSLFAVSVERMPGLHRVFNIEVDGEHEYFANGILTHNCSWRYPDAFDMLNFGLRLGTDPRMVITTTPKPTKLVRAVMADVTTVITRGSTFDNAANLAPTAIAQLRAKYDGTRIGRQELYAEVLNDVPGALWTQAMIEAARRMDAPPPMKRIVVAIDPAISSHEGSDETGIVVVGVDGQGFGYVLEDLSARMTPDEWATAAVDAFTRHKADRIVAEKNQGGDMVESNIRMKAARVPYTGVHASKGKYVRAEPVASLYEQQRIRHSGIFATLEDQMTSFTPDIDRKSLGSPDRMDALVWGFTELMVDLQVQPARVIALRL